MIKHLQVTVYAYLISLFYHHFSWIWPHLICSDRDLVHGTHCFFSFPSMGILSGDESFGGGYGSGGHLF